MSVKWILRVESAAVFVVGIVAYLSLGGQPLHSIEELLGYLGDEKVGTQVQAKVLRAGEVREVSLTIGRRS